MENKDKVRFAEIMTGLAEMYEMNISNVGMEMWFNLLKNHGIKEISGAVSDYMRNPDTGSYKPKPADIIKAIEGSTTDQAAVAWTKLDKAVRMIGDYQSVVFDDPIIHKVLTEMGGWIGFGDKDEKEWPFIMREFTQRYRVYAAKGAIADFPNKLIGSHEDYNFKNGLAVTAPVMIGEPSKAQLVLDSSGSKPLQITSTK